MFHLNTICLAAVQQTGWALEYVPPELKTAAICLAAVQQTGWAITHVPPEHYLSSSGSTDWMGT